MKQKKPKPIKYTRTLICKVTEVTYASILAYADATQTSNSWVCRTAFERLLADLPRPAKEAPQPRQRDHDGTWDGAEL
jgi:hypothetical protein